VGVVLEWKLSKHRTPEGVSTARVGRLHCDQGAGAKPRKVVARRFHRYTVGTFRRMRLCSRQRSDRHTVDSVEGIPTRIEGDPPWIHQNVRQIEVRDGSKKHRSNTQPRAKRVPFD